MSLNQAKTVVYEDYVVYELICGYSDYGKINIELGAIDAIIDSCDFSDEVKFVFAVKEDVAKNFYDRIVDLFYGRVIPKEIDRRIDYK